MLTDDNCSSAAAYLSFAYGNMMVARHAPGREFWTSQAIENMRIAADRLGFELVPWPAEKLEAAE